MPTSLPRAFAPLIICLGPLALFGCGEGSSPTAVPQPEPTASVPAIVTGVALTSSGFDLSFLDGANTTIDVTEWRCFSDLAGCDSYFVPPANRGDVACELTTTDGNIGVRCTTQSDPVTTLTSTFSRASFGVELASPTTQLTVTGSATSAEVTGDWALSSSTCNCQGNGSFAAAR